MWAPSSVTVGWKGVDVDSERARGQAIRLLTQGRFLILTALAAGVLFATPISARGDQSGCGDFASLLSTSIHMTNTDAGLANGAASGLSGVPRTDKLRSLVREAIGIYEDLLKAANGTRSAAELNPTIRAAWKSLATGLALRINAYSILAHALTGPAMSPAQKSAYSRASARITANNERWTPIAAALNKLYRRC